MLLVKVIGQKTVKQNDCKLVSGAVNFTQIQFEFDESWNGLNKTYQFSNGGINIDVVTNETTLFIPQEVLIEGTLGVKVFAEKLDENGTVVETKATVNPVFYNVVSSGIVEPADNTEPVTPTDKEQIRQMAEEAKTSADGLLQVVTEIKGQTDALLAVKGDVEQLKNETLIAEQNAKTAADGVVTAEAQRVSAENARVVAETERANTFETEKDTLLQQKSIEIDQAKNAKIAEVSTQFQTKYDGLEAEYATDLSRLNEIYKYNVKNYGAVGDGIANDRLAIQRAVDAAWQAGGGTVFLPQGKYKLTQGIVWRTKVSLIGAGIGKSILYPVGSGFAAITYNDAWASTTNVHENCDFMNFEIDGTNLIDASYTVASKGIFILYMRNCVFQNLYIHDTPATGLGVDFLDGCFINQVFATNCGKSWTTGNIGGAGIGIGVGAWNTDEPLIMSKCITRGCGNYGIFIEQQFGGMQAKDIIISECIAINGRNTGICNKGADRVIISNCVIKGNAFNGLSVDSDCNDCEISNCIITDNGYDGLWFKINTINNYSIKSNKFARNVKCGIRVEARTGSKDIEICGNEFYANAMAFNLSTAILEGIKINDNKMYLNTYSAAEINSVLTRSELSHNEIFNNNNGISFHANATFLHIIDNWCFDSRTPKVQARGISQDAASVFDMARIEMNDCRGNVYSGQGLRLLGTNTNTVVNNNLI